MFSQKSEIISKFRTTVNSSHRVPIEYWYYKKDSYSTLNNVIIWKMNINNFINWFCEAIDTAPIQTLPFLTGQ